jgi:hypothetical protein
MTAEILIQHLDKSLSSHTFIDFCAGGGGPTPRIERAINKHLVETGQSPVDFVLTDLHPNVDSWAKASARSPHVRFMPDPVDASAVQESLVEQYSMNGRMVFRLFNLAFHHFEDPLAKAILKNTVETSQGFA